MRYLLLAVLVLAAPAVASAQELFPAPEFADAPFITPSDDEKDADEEFSRIYVSPLCPPALRDGSAQIELEPPGFKWGPALRQSMLFLTVQHTFRMTELKTRRELPGPFFRDYFDSLKTLGGWADGGRQFTNYVAHPMQGALYGFIQIQNDPSGIKQEFGGSKDYWKSRMKAMGWAAIWSTQFELGPLSQASIGNVGLSSKKLTYVDIVITPTVGTAWVVAEDILDRWAVQPLLRNSKNRFKKAIVSMSLTPMRSVSNILRFKAPWSRD